MKTLLDQFFRSLTCKLMWAMVATAAAANAHDLPSDCPLAHHDWGILEQDCMGFRSSNFAIVDSAPLNPAATLREIIALAPDVGEPPAPIRTPSRSVASHISDKTIYDGVDCSILESQFRGYPLVEATAAQVRASRKSVAVNDPQPSDFDKLYYGACYCEFQQEATTPQAQTSRSAFDRTCVEDSIPLEFHFYSPRFLNQLGVSFDSPSTQEIVPLASVVPATTLSNKDWVSDAMNELSHWECVLRSELYDCHHAFLAGKQLASFSGAWYQDALPQLASGLRQIKVTETDIAKTATKYPMYVLFSLGDGETLAVPAEQAKVWKFSGAASVAQEDDRATDTAVRESVNDSDIVQNVQPTPGSGKVSAEFKAMLDHANSRLKWAGGRLSTAADYVNGWLSNRIARTSESDTLR
jgi:hypothetical protein